VAWVQNLPGAASVFLDRETLEIEHVAKAFTPLAWTGDEDMLGWRRNDKGRPMIGIYRLAERGKLYALAGMAPPAGLIQVRPLYSGAPPLAALLAPEGWRGPHEQDVQRHAGSSVSASFKAVLCAGARIWLMDLRSGKRVPVGKQQMWMGCPVTGGPFLWGVVDRAGGPRLVRLEVSDDGIRESSVWSFPEPGFWFVAAFDGNGLWLFRDPGIRGAAHGGGVSTTTSRNAELWRFNVFGRSWNRDTTPLIEFDSSKAGVGARLVAISPDGRWMVLRRDGDRLDLREPSPSARR
jgi:hypothetical protein